ncbi:MAG: hypothetical protein CL760_11630 [Chloroflexi bacterium]|nr:hypothetical protein [Chloroflexota bacterium]|tara:strand:- start:95390 stop:96172 length:783 start_codon:yes stop_codon:yes gene_type:complete
MFEDKKYELNDKIDNILFKIRRVRDRNPIKSYLFMGLLFVINIFLLLSNFLVGILTSFLLFTINFALKGEAPFKENLDFKEYSIKKMAYSKYKNEKAILYQFKALKEETDLGILKEHYRIVSKIVSKHNSVMNFIENDFYMTKKYKKGIPSCLTGYYFSLLQNKKEYYSNISLLQELLMDLELRLLTLENKSNSLNDKKEIKEKSLKIIEEKKKRMLKEISSLDHQKEVIEKEIKEIEIKQFYKENDMFEINEESYTETL